MNVVRLAVGPFESNCYLVRGASPAGLVIDPGCDADRIVEAVRRLDLTPAAYLLTHGHIDHVSATADVAGAFPAPVYLHPADGAWAFSPANRYPPYYGPPRFPKAGIVDVRDGQTLEAGGFSIRVIATPGHSPGGVCFHFETGGELFTGDTLFRGTVGRTDLPGGDSRALAESLKRLVCLPDRTTVRPGHGEASTLAEEIRSNFFLAAAARAPAGGAPEAARRNRRP